MQDVDRPAQIQALAQPGRARRPRVEAEPLRVVLRAEGLDRIGGHRGRRRDLGQEPAVRPPELQRAVGLSIDLVALLVHRAVVPATEQGEVRERGRAALRPVTDVMALAEAAARSPGSGSPGPGGGARAATPGESSASGPRPPQRPSSSCRITTRLASHARRRDVSAGTRAPVLEDGLAGLIRVRQHRGIDVDHHLVALARGAGIEPVVRGPSPRAGPARRPAAGPWSGAPRRDRRGSVAARSSARLRWYSVSRAAASARRSRAPTSGSSRPRTTTMPSSSWWTCSARLACCRAALPGLGLAVHAPPAAHDALDVGGRAGAPHRRAAALRSPAWRRGSGRGPSRTTARRGRGPGPGAAASPGRAPRGPAPGPRRGRGRPPAQPGGAGAEAGVPAAAGSNSRIRSRRRAVAASRCADSSAISSPSRSSSATRSEGGEDGVASGSPWRASLLLGRLYTRVSEPSGALRTGDPGTSDDFWSAPARPRHRGARAGRWAVVRWGRPTLGRATRPGLSSGKYRRDSFLWTGAAEPLAQKSASLAAVG